tara:strand:+ start:348 stop:605 length:258 start_codon:yes stop_codon:yes gene_type:complete
MVLGSILLESIPLVLKLGIGTTETVITVISWSSKLIYNQVINNKKEDLSALNERRITDLNNQIETLTYEIQSMKDDDYDEKVIEF